VTRLNSVRGRRSLGNEVEVHPRDRERIADIGNEADRQPEHNSNSPPWVVNVSKAHLAKRGLNSFQDWSEKPGHLYIGRACRGSGGVGSQWGNPYTILPERTLEEVLRLFTEHLHSSPELLDGLGDLVGKELGCWCKPNPCHGDILVEECKRWLAREDSSSALAEVEREAERGGDEEVTSGNMKKRVSFRLSNNVTTEIASPSIPGLVFEATPSKKKRKKKKKNGSAERSEAGLSSSSAERDYRKDTLGERLRKLQKQLEKLEMGEKRLEFVGEAETGKCEREERRREVRQEIDTLQQRMQNFK